MSSSSSSSSPSLSSIEEELASKTPTFKDGMPAVIISEEDDERLFKKWQHSLVGHTTGKLSLNSPLLSAVKKLWKPRGTMELFTLGNGFLLFKFSDLEDHDSVWSRVPWYILGKPIILQKLSRNFSPIREEFGSIPLWAKLPEPNLCCGSKLDNLAAMKSGFDVCGSCGRSELLNKKPGGISTKGKRIILHVQDLKDLSRDVVKSNSACVKIPELELELAIGRLNGLITTVKGLVYKISKSLKSEYRCWFVVSVREMLKKKCLEFDYKLKKLLDLEEPWTLILDDALASSFIAPVTDAIEEDKQLTVEEYERTWEQNEELRLNAYNSTSTGKRKKKEKKKKKKKNFHSN